MEHMMPIRDYSIGDRVKTRMAWNEYLDAEIINKQVLVGKYETRVCYTMRISANVTKTAYVTYLQDDVGG